MGVERDNGIYTAGVSVAFIVSSSLIIELLRKGSHQVFRDKEILKVVLEALAAAELCANCFELNVVFRNHGIGASMFGLFCCTLWWNYHWDGATSGPDATIVNWLDGKEGFLKIIVITLAQFAGGYFVWFCVMKPFWWFELLNVHKLKLTPCYFDVHTHYLIAAAIEGAGVFACDVGIKILNGRQIPCTKLIDTSINVLAVYLAFEYSGGYYNPVQGTVFTFGCKNSSIYETIVVYWIGAIAGSILANLMFKVNSIHSILIGTPRHSHAHFE